jgi:hypothetical protein
MAERRHYSLLLSRAARYSQTDLWVVANRLPDPLASIFIPIEGQTAGFEGYITMNGGLTLEASLDAESEANADKVADGVRQSIGTLPAVAQGLKVRVDARNVFLSLEVDEAEFAAGLRGSPVRPPLAPKTVAAIPVAPAPIVPPAPPQPAGPQVIKIFGLEDGPREIILPPAKPDKP